MGFNEFNWLNEYNLNKPKFHLRYADDILVAFDKEQDSLNFLTFHIRSILISNLRQKNKQSIPQLFLMYSVLESIKKTSHIKIIIINQPILDFSQVLHPFSFKVSLIECLIDKSFKIRNNLNSFHDIENYHYCKLPYINNLSHHLKNKLSKLCKENFNIKLIFNSFKIKNYFSYKDSIHDDLKPFLVYKFTCDSCSSSYIGETCRHFKTTIEEYIKKDNKSHIFKHLHSNKICFGSYNSLSFRIIDKANSKFDLKIKEVLHKSNAQQNHLALTLSIQHASSRSSFVSLFFVFLCHLLFSLSLTLLISIFYCLNQPSLFLHVIRAHLSFLSIIFIISKTNLQRLLLC